MIRKIRRRVIKEMYFREWTMAIKRSSTKPHRFTADVLLTSNRVKNTQDIQLWGQWQVFVISQKNREGITLKPTQKSATASETINALVLVRRFRLLQTRKIVNPFPMMVRNERNQPRIQNQVSILAVKGSSVKLWDHVVLSLFKTSQLLQRINMTQEARCFKWINFPKAYFFLKGFLELIFFYGNRFSFTCNILIFKLIFI